MKLSKAAAIVRHLSISAMTTMIILSVLTIQVSFHVAQGAIDCDGITASSGGAVCDTNTNTFQCNESTDGCASQDFTGVQGTTSKCVGVSPANSDVCQSLKVYFDSADTNNQGMTCDGALSCTDVLAIFSTASTKNSKRTLTCKGGTSANAACSGFFAVSGGCLICDGPNSCSGTLQVLEGSGGFGAKIVRTAPGEFFQGTLGFNCEDKKKAALSACFSSSNTVEVQGKGLKTMDSLKVGDYVKTGITNDGHSLYSRLMSKMHKDHHAVVDYFQIYTEGAPKVPLEISSDHFLYLNNNKVVRAKDVQVGDILKGNSAHMAVTHIDSIQRQGLYAPVTEDGTIWVSGVVASSYISLVDNDVVSPDQQVLASHMALAPLRLMCKMGSFSICKDETYSEEGYSTNLLNLIKFGLHFLSFDLPMQLLMLIVSAPVLLIVAGLEMIMNHGIMVGVTIGGLIVIASKTNKITK